jgi:hypothetical protein
VVRKRDQGGGKRPAGIHFCLFFAAVGGADRTSAHGSVFFFASGRQVHDTMKVEEVSRKLDEWQGKLPEFTALVGGLTDLDPNSEDAQEIGSIILKLDEFCD